MATIYKRKLDNGRYSYYLNLSISGKRIRKFAGYSLKSAYRTLQKREYELTYNQSLGITSLSFNQIIDSYTEYIESTNISINQIKLLKSKITYFLNFCKSRSITQINNITSKEALEFINKRSQTIVRSQYNSYKEDIYTSIKPSTLNRDIGYLKRFFNYCIDMKWINNNPFRCVKRFKNKLQKQRFYFTKKNLKLIFEKGSKYTDFYTFLLKTGLRSTDVYKLRRKHIKGSYLGILMNKTDDFLHIPLSAPILELIRPRFEHDFIFPEVQSDRQKRRCLKEVQKVFDSQFVRENNITLHTFRHTYAHNMLDKGVPKEVLQTLLGHRSIKTTEIYANWVKTKELEKWV